MQVSKFESTVVSINDEAGVDPNDRSGTVSDAPTVAVVVGPCDATTLSSVLANGLTRLGDGSCDVSPNSACDHGTFIIGLLGARQDALIPGLCPESWLFHIPLFVDANSPSASVDELANAITTAITAGARLINLSLAILGDEAEINPRLAAALDFAEASGALLLVAAGNQGRLAMGQLLSHPVVIPVAATDASQKLLPECNFGPAISRRGIAALGRMPGYAPGGGTTVMSGTSVATAVATGTLAQVWSAHPEIDGHTLRSVVAGLGPRGGSKPPILNRDLLLAALDQIVPAAVTATRAAEMTSYASLQGATTMAYGNGQPPSTQRAGPIAGPAQTVAPAGGAGECACGAPGGVCTCNGALGPSRFVYAIGTIEADYPYVAIERDMQALAEEWKIDFETDRDPTRSPTEDRHWQYQVLSRDRKVTRFIARQLRWRLTIEDSPVFVLSPNDPSYFDDLIDALAPTDESKSQRRGGKRKAVAPSSEPPLAEDLDVVVGVAGPLTPDGIAVAVDQIFNIKPGKLTPDGLTHFSQLPDNHGLTDEDRAYNFLAARYELPLDKLKKPELSGFEFSGVRVIPSRLGAGTGRIVRAIYTLRNGAYAKKEFFLRIDVTHEFPTIVSPWQPYLERGEAS